MGLTAVDILETIRDNATDSYIERVPQATRDNLAQVGKAITSDSNIMNEFITSLVNKIAFSHVKSKMFKNPLAILKSAGIPKGNTIEEIYINPSTDTGYDNEQTKLLKTTKPDGKTAYYGLNRQSTYPVTINEAQLQRAFTSESEFMSLYNAIMVSMYSGDEIDEFMLMKGLVGKAIDEGAMLVLDADLTKPKEFAKAISNVSKNFSFPSTQYAGYNKVNESEIEANRDTACVTWCPTSEQCLLIRADAQTEIDYEVLATMFHMEVAKLEAMTILVDSFPSELYDVKAVLCDREAVQVRDMVYKMTSQYVGNTLEWNFWLHHWQFLFLSMFGNAVAFGSEITG